MSKPVEEGRLQLTSVKRVVNTAIARFEKAHAKYGEAVSVKKTGKETSYTVDLRPEFFASLVVSQTAEALRSATLTTEYIEENITAGGEKQPYQEKSVVNVHENGDETGTVMGTRHTRLGTKPVNGTNGIAEMSDMMRMTEKMLLRHKQGKSLR